MINYIESKAIDYEKVKDLLSISQALNHFTNNGPVKGSLEKKLAKLLNISCDKKVVCFNNGTTALHAIMFLCRKKYNATKWITPAFTFPSAVVGGEGIADVSICDIDQGTFTLPMDELLLKDVSGVIITNLFGATSDLKAWEDFCRANNKFLILDNASSPMSAINGVNICNFGNYSFGSLHHTKFLGFGEGGFAVAPKEDYNALNAIANFGFYDAREHDKLSSNFKMSDISAAFIIQHIDNYDLDKHIEIQNVILDGIKDKNKARPLGYTSEVVYGNLPIIFLDKTDHNSFKSFSIIAQKYYKPLKALPNSMMLYDKIVNFPLYSSLKENEVNGIIDAINTYSEMI
jgi:dTDP-4-amino-4,6-dideoxygalactose transaminase